MGSNDSKSESKPLSAGERAAIYEAGSKATGADGRFPSYWVPAYDEPRSARTISGGDYDRLESNIVESRTAPLQRQLAVDREALDADLNRRGIWSSGIAVRAQNDLTERYLPQLRAAGAEAATQRYGMEAGELSRLDERAMMEAAAKNAYRQNQNDKIYEAEWRPYDYRAGLWNGTGGVISSGTSGGWSI